MNEITFFYVNFDICFASTRYNFKPYSTLAKIIECVPNFSVGQNPEVIHAIAQSIRTVEQVKLLDIDSGYHANRTVMTFAGDPHAVAEAAFQAIKVASELIDMSVHRGEHPRIGATDVCPLIPISGIGMTEVIELSKKLGERVAQELNIPVYLYEYSATTDERKNLAWLRKGEYEGLQTKLSSGNFQPDYGMSAFNSKSGISIIGARNFLIAYNINLATKDVSIAKTIAEEIRESGKNGKPGILRNVKAIGWYIEEFDKVQISMNLTDFKTTSVFEVFETVHQKAIEAGTEVTGSELVGLIPLEAIADCGIYFLKKNHMHHHLPHSELVAYAAQYLGLNEVKPFDAQKKVIEFALTD